MANMIWIVDDDDTIAWVLQKTFEEADYQTRIYKSAEAALKDWPHKMPNAVFTDVRMPGMGGFEFAQILQREAVDLPVIIMTAFSDLESAVDSYQAGAYEYLPKPFDLDEALSVLARALPRDLVDTEQADSGSVSKLNSDQPEHRRGQSLRPKMIGAAPAMQEVFRLVGRLSHSSINVLIRGESGVGKELVARALHDSSPRKAKPFIEINTGAIPAELLESELFGHEKGAFTGATQQRKGRFEQADGGTLFLDEIGDMPAELQTRLLRVLSEKRFYRVGGTSQLQVDVRVIAATNQSLEQRVEKGLFRLDLFHRLNVVEIKVPNLNERKADINLLAQQFLTDAASEFDVAAKSFAASAITHLKAYQWPGNVRELENLCRRLTVTAPGRMIEPSDLPAAIGESKSDMAVNKQPWQKLFAQQIRSQLLHGETDIHPRLQSQIDRILIETALAFTQGHKQKAAQLLGWGRNTLTRKIKELKL